MINSDDFLPEHLHHAKTFYRQSLVYGVFASKSMQECDYERALKHLDKQRQITNELLQLKKLKQFHQDYTDRENLFRHLSSQGVRYSFITKPNGRSF